MSRARTIALTIATCMLIARSASAEPDAVYVEVLGKGGLWGLGYNHELHPRLSLGAVGSFSVVDHQRISSLSPFVTTYLVGTTHHRWFADVGPQLVHVSTPSPVPEWMGTSSTGIGAQLTTGYEYHRHVVLRVFTMVVAGKSGVAPWIGADVGWAL